MASEVARLRAQIEAEYEAAQRALRGFAAGTTRHAFITARMERMGDAMGQLANLVGMEKAAAILVEAIEGEAMPPSAAK
ncbi:MAG: hypothetical protein JOZ18_16415 [Chloroflexi bacterium]|nr:hypothetical protein [Chloroflexota bacterium]